MTRSGPSKVFIRMCATVVFVTVQCGVLAGVASAEDARPVKVSPIGTWNVTVRPGDNADDIVGAIPGNLQILALREFDLPKHEQSTPEGDSLDEFLRAVSQVIVFDPIGRRTVWSYRATPASDFSTATIGTSQRLPNGNTLITESERGRVFEVDRSHNGGVEFYSPHRVPGADSKLIASLYEMERVPSPWLD